MRKNQKMPAAVQFVRDNLERVFPNGRHSKRHTGMFADEFNAAHGYEAISTWTMKTAMDTVCEEVFGSPEVVRPKVSLFAAEVVDESDEQQQDEGMSDSGKSGGLTVQKVADLYRMEEEGNLCPVNFEDVWPRTGETRNNAKARLVKLFGLMAKAGTATTEELIEISINFEGSKGGRQQGTSYMMSLNVTDQFYADMPGIRGVVGRKILIDGFKENERRKRVGSGQPTSNGMIGQALQMIGGALIDIESKIEGIDTRLKKVEERPFEPSEQNDGLDPSQMVTIRAYVKEMRLDPMKNSTYGKNATTKALSIMASYKELYGEDVSHPIYEKIFCEINGSKNLYRRWMLDMHAKEIFTSVILSSHHNVDMRPIMKFIRKSS